MPLLELTSSGECCLARDLIDKIPPYAILSHTWRDDNEEVTFQDFVQGISKSKAIEKSSFVKNKRLEMVFNTSG